MKGKIADTTEWVIYVLIDPITSRVRYVGWTVNIDLRIRTHINNAKRGLPGHKYNWIRKLLNQDLVCTYEIVEYGVGNTWAEAERKWIAYYQSLGTELTNATKGGEGVPGYIPNESTRRKMSIAHLGRKHSDVSIEKIRRAHIGRGFSESHRRNLSNAKKGIPQMSATNAAAVVNRGSRQSREHIEKRIAPLRGGVRLEHRKETRQINGEDAWLCSPCGKWKVRSDWPKAPSSWRGVSSKCKACHAAYQREQRRKKTKNEVLHETSLA